MGGYFIKKQLTMSMINRVYQKVLTLANKEQRGYITPQEFNNFADMAQKEIFNSYFYTLEEQRNKPGESQGNSDNVKFLEEKIARFQIYNEAHNLTNDEGVFDYLDIIPDLYKLTQVRVNYTDGYNTGSYGYGNTASNYVVADEINIHEDYHYVNTSRLINNLTEDMKMSATYSYNSNSIRILPAPDNNTIINISYIRIPKNPNWTFLISQGENALYNQSAADHQDFELHPSEETLLVVKILQLAGVAIKDFNLAQVAAQKEVAKIQQEN